MSISALERLPAELLCHIATIYLSQNHDITIITQICHRIRHVVFGISSIWSAIKLLTTDNNYSGPTYAYEDVRDLYF
jgi:hypothetical protein